VAKRSRPLAAPAVDLRRSLDIADDPGGSRSGIFYGGNGMFG
jgi:hypothetical protein